MRQWFDITKFALIGVKYVLVAATGAAYAFLYLDIRR